MRLLNSLGVGELASYLYPTIYDCSQPIPEQTVGPHMFPTLRLSILRLLTDGIYIAGKFCFISFLYLLIFV